MLITSATSANGGTTLMTIADLGRVRMRVTIDEVEMANIRVGLQASVAVDAFADRTFDGVLEKIEPQAVVTQGVTFFPVMVSISNKEGLLMPGMNGEVTIKAADLHSVLQVPIDAIRATNELAPVARMFSIPVDTLTSQLRRDLVAGEGTTGIPGRYVIVELPGGGNKYEMRLVKVGPTDLRVTEITEGLKEGDKVVMLGAIMSKKPAVPPRLQIADNMKRGAPTAREAEAAAAPQVLRRRCSPGALPREERQRSRETSWIGVGRSRRRVRTCPAADRRSRTRAGQSKRTLATVAERCSGGGARNSTRCRRHQSAPRQYTLAEVVDVALRNSPATRLSWSSARAAADVYGSSEGRIYPTVTAGVTANRSLQIATAGRPAGERTQYGPTLSLAYTVLDFGGRSGSIDVGATDRDRGRSHAQHDGREYDSCRWRPRRSAICRRARSATRRSPRWIWRPPRSTQRTSGIALGWRRSPTCSRRERRARRRNCSC